MDSATSMAAEAALSALFQRLFDTLALPFLKRIGSLFGVEEEAKKLKLTLSRIKALLTDAEERQIKEESVRLWLSELKGVAYDAEDILDELEYIALQSKLEELPMQTRKRKFTDQVRVPRFFSRFSSNFDLGSRIKEIRERLDEIERENKHLHLKVIHESERLKPSMRPPTSSIVDESIVFGREADKAKVVRLLTSDNSLASDSGIQVVPICGMGGLGKTTLAQLAYNDEHVVKHFEVKAWVYVSEDFNLIRLANAIVKSVTGSDPHLTDSDPFQVSIKEALNGKKFLLVLDDVWNENCNDWDALRAPLMFGARGSRILVTTRSQRVSSIMGTVAAHSLQGLSDDDCWSLFKKRAFVEGNSDAYRDLGMIGKEIVNKCKGLPLAVKTLGGLLRSVVDVGQWEAILKSEIWDLPEERSGILPALRLSYHHLPAHLKRCFAYCCIFPRDSYFIDSDELVWMWMAQGFIQSEGSKDMEDIGKEYLADLVSRSLLNYVGSSHLGMHDLIHDLARSVSGAEILKIRDWKKSHKNAEKVRHLSCRLSRSSLESFNFENLYCFKSLRTLKLYRGDRPTVRDSWSIPLDLFVNLRHLRILDLCGNHITELPESIGNLIQLRYLNLSRTLIERLPKSITRLYNLQTLDLTSCSKLVGVPSDFSNLVNLRKIFAIRCSASIPFGGLKSLQYLEQGFKVGREIGYRVNELRDLNCLRRAFISELENVNSVEEAKEAELKNKQKIRNLSLNWTWNSHGVDYFKMGNVSYPILPFLHVKSVSLPCQYRVPAVSRHHSSRQEGIEEEVLNALQPHTNLECLRIRGYCGVRFPTWLGDSSFSKLVSITLVECKCPLLPPFGQLPSLEYLRLGNLYGLEKVGREFYGDGMVKGFPSLKRLEISDSPDLEEWTALEGDMIHVREIWIRRCSKLRVLPDIFPLTLDSLEIYDCPLLTSLGDEVLPATLHDLAFNQCDNLNRLPTGLKNLTSLAKLELFSCPKIHFLPEELPTSTLDRLIIRGCPLVTEKCKEGGEYWSKISHIPKIQIDDFQSPSVPSNARRRSDGLNPRVSWSLAAAAAPSSKSLG